MEDLVEIKCEPESYEVKTPKPELAVEDDFVPRTRRGTKRVLLTPTDWKPTPFGFTPDEIRSVMLEKNVDERKAIKMLKDRERTRARRKHIKDDYEFEKQEEERLRRNELTRRRRAILRGETSQDIDLSEQEQKRIVERSYEKMSADDILYEKIKNAQRKRMRRRELKAKNVYGDAKSGPESSESDG